MDLGHNETTGAVRTWAALTEASALATVAVLPYLLSMQKEALDVANAKRVAGGKRSISMATIAALAFAQSHVTFGVAAALGLRAGRTMGLGAPYLQARLSGRPAGLPVSQAARYAGTGAGAAMFVLAMDRTMFAKLHKAMAHGGAREPGIWQGALAAFYGGIAEEVLVRLGLQTLIAAGVRRVRGETTTPPSGATMWPAIAVSTLALGAGHLPATSRLTPLTPAVVARALTLNGAAGVAFGYLYWKRGLEAGMIAHGAADVVLHVGGAMLHTE